MQDHVIGQFSMLKRAEGFIDSVAAAPAGMTIRAIVWLLSYNILFSECRTFDKVLVDVISASTTYRESFVMGGSRQNPDLYVRVTFNTPNGRGRYGQDSFIGLTRVASNKGNVTFATPMLYD